MERHRAPADPRRSSQASLFLVILAATTVFAACGRARPVEVVVEIPPAEEARWRTLVESHPLPEEFVVTLKTDVAPAAAATATTAHADPAVRLERIVAPALRSTALRRVLDRRRLAPAVPLWDPGSVAGELRPLDEIDLPLIAAPVDGRYPDDHSYPLVEQLVITLDLEAVGLEIGDARRNSLRAWFLSLPVDRAAPPTIVWLGGVGDLMVGRGVTELLDRSDGLSVVFSDVLPLMQGADYLLGNLEGAVTTRGEPLAKGFTFRFHPRVLAPLARAGFDYFSIVNNHSYDYGEIGFLDTLDHLAASPIATSGAGRTLEQASRPLRTVVSTEPSAPESPPATGECPSCADDPTAPGAAAIAELPVSVLSVGAYPVERSGFDGARATAATETRPGVLWADPRNPVAHEAALAAMRAAFGEESFDIVLVHGGAEWASAPSQAQRELYRSYVDAGADLVLGHHSHVVQGMEAYRGALIAYSLGNFVFPGMYLTEYGEQSVLLRVGVVDGVIRYVRPVPVRIDHQLLSLDPTGPLLPRMLALTRRLHE